MTRPPPGAPWPTASTRPVVLLGWPVGHSLSPVLHNAAFREQGLDLVYLALPTPPEQLVEVVNTLGAVGAVGANVTVPHKIAVQDACDQLTVEAELVGAVNTLTWTADGLVGDNTDAVGLADAMAADAAVVPGAPIVVLGTGGAARAVAVATARLGCPVTVVGRRTDAARELVSLAERVGSPFAQALDMDDAGLHDTVAKAHTVINATPLGMDGESLPAPLHELTPDQVAYDLVYTPPETPFLAAAKARGAAAHHGLGMLVAQAATSYRRWTGREAPRATMSAAAIGALGSTGFRYG